MIQQINLYQEGLNRSQGNPAIMHYAYGFALILLLLIGFSIYLAIDLNHSKKNLQETQNQLRDAEIEVQLLREKYPQQQINPLITQEISRLQNITASLSQVIHLLSDTKSDQTQGFSRYFSALAAQSISDVWLSSIVINAEQNNLTVKGSTFNTEKIPVFLKKLHNEPIFQGRAFASLIVTQAKETQGQHNFAVSTSTQTLEKTDTNE